MIQTDDLMRAEELQEITRLSAPSIRKRVREGSLPTPIRIGRRVLFRRDEVAKALEQLKEGRADNHRDGAAPVAAPVA